MSILGKFLRKITPIVQEKNVVDDTIKEKVKDLYSNDTLFGIYREMTDLFTDGITATGFKSEHIPQRELTETKINGYTLAHERYCRVVSKKGTNTTTQHKTIQHQFKREDVDIYLSELSTHLQSLNYRGDFTVLDRLPDMYYECVDKSRESIKHMSKTRECIVLLEIEKHKNGTVEVTVQRGHRDATLPGINRIELFENHSYVFRKNTSN